MYLRGLQGGYNWKDDTAVKEVITPAVIGACSVLADTMQTLARLADERLIAAKKLAEHMGLMESSAKMLAHTFDLGYRAGMDYTDLMLKCGERHRNTEQKNVEYLEEQQHSEITGEETIVKCAAAGAEKREEEARNELMKVRSEHSIAERNHEAGKEAPGTETVLLDVEDIRKRFAKVGKDGQLDSLKSIQTKMDRLLDLHMAMLGVWSPQALTQSAEEVSGWLRWFVQSPEEKEQ
ncbi:hypothetical protein R1sor_009924 [Riccia sorocarpa]|uniref:Uncharacterized protein n=1 Tax=Riccia sorocarpa TaxID=122646 RepID=A0ABD3HWM4_9MARC